jgi:catechol 2,3-dioxygenase-like lactoylglutathione lyase family enzyme
MAELTACARGAINIGNHQRDPLGAACPLRSGGRRLTIQASNKATEAIVFDTTKAVGSFAVDNLAAARRFYGQTLGLRVSEEGGPLMLHLAGDQRILVYPKPDHTPATFTILNFPVDDIDQAVDELAVRGVPIQRYEDFQTDDRGIYRGQGHSIAWFTDPAGNVLSVIQED